MNDIDLHLNRNLDNVEIISTIKNMFNIHEDKIVITEDMEEILTKNDFEIWIHKEKRRFGDFPLSLGIYPQLEKYNKTELEYAEYFAELNKIECVIVPPDKHEYAEWLLVTGFNKHKIFVEDIDYEYPDDEDGIIISRFK